MAENGAGEAAGALAPLPDVREVEGELVRDFGGLVDRVKVIAYAIKDEGHDRR